MFEKGSNDEAEAVLKQALELDAEEARAHSALGEIALEKYDTRAAVEFLVNARRIDPINRTNPDQFALAYGRTFFPFNLADRFIRLVKPWRQANYWSVQAAIGTCVIAIHCSFDFSTVKNSVFLNVLFILLYNLNVYVLYPTVLDSPARAIGRYVARRELGFDWRDAFNDDVIWDVLRWVVCHLVATILARFSTHPVMGLFVSLILSGSSIFPRGILFGSTDLVIPRYLILAYPFAIAGMIYLGVRGSVFLYSNDAMALYCWGGILGLSALGIVIRRSAEEPDSLSSSKR